MIDLLRRDWGEGDISVTQAVSGSSITTEILVRRGARILYLHQDLESS